MPTPASMFVGSGLVGGDAQPDGDPPGCAMRV